MSWEIYKLNITSSGVGFATDPKPIYATEADLRLASHGMHPYSSEFDKGCGDVRLDGPMLRNFPKLELRTLLSSGSSSSKELIRTVAAFGRACPILCSMIENGDFKFPNNTPLGKSPRRSSENPGMNFKSSFSRPEFPVNIKKKLPI